MTDLQSLLARVSEATGPDREIDALIWTAVTGHETHYPNPYVHEDDAIRAFTAPIDGMGPQNRWQRVPAVTESLDAAVALMDRLLPLSTWHIHFYGIDRIAQVKIYQNFRGPPYMGVKAEASAATPAVALCAALIKAMIAIEARQSDEGTKSVSPEQTASEQKSQARGETRPFQTGGRAE